MQSAPFSDTSSQIMNDSLSRFSSVISTTPAKRITFYKSGDTQFSGIRMPIHKRSFKCFDALLDDLSQKMPLPFGVRTITTPKGTRAIRSLEQLQDGGCYLCSDRNYVKPISMETAGKRSAVWHHSSPINIRRKPSRPDEPPIGHTGHHYHRQPKKIMLVKNNDPAVRRSIVLSRKRTRSLRVFIDEISELMQCHVRTLYTLEGRKIDSTQSLMQCPSVLVCVGREPFKPFLLENLRKNSEEKLPGIGARSHSSIYSDGHDSKKNVNFGLETKKSIIHPRSDSSNKSTRFSLSSEKSYPNGSGMTPGQQGFITKEVIMNDDVEKRVLVNKDGSLSVEMKVCFRLVNDETLHWSTEIKKLPTSANECNSLQEGVPDCIQNKVVYSEPESITECETEKACSSKCHQMDLESYCQSCCSHSQGYDIWKNPLHNSDETGGLRSTSNSVGSSNKIMHQKSSLDSMYTISRSSQEYTEHTVEKASCFQQTTKEGDTRIEYCSKSRCSQSEVSASITKCSLPLDTWKRQGVSQEGHADTDSMYSGRSSVSKVSTRAQYCCCSQCREATTSIVESEDGLRERMQNSLSGDSKASKQSQTRIDSLRTVLSDTSAQKASKEELKRRNRSTNDMSTCTCLSVKSMECPCCGGCGKFVSTMRSNIHGIPVQVDEKDDEMKSLVQRSCKSPMSERSNKHTHCAQQTDSIPNVFGNIEPVPMSNMAEVEVRHACSQSTLFDLTHHLPASKQSNESKQQIISANTGVKDEVEGKTKSATSVRSVGSVNTNSDISDKLTMPRLDKQVAEEIENLYITQENITEKVMQDFCRRTKERVCSAMSTQTHSSEGSDKSYRSQNIQNTAADSPQTSLNSPNKKLDSERSRITLSQTAQVSAKSNACLESDLDTLSNSSDMNAGQNTRHTIDNSKYSSQNSLPVASPSPKSPITVETNSLALTVKSGSSKASSKSTRSNKHHCCSRKCVQRISKSPSGKSKPPKSVTPASNGPLDEPLSPTSSTSVSLRLIAEERSENLNGCFMSSTSQIIEPRCLSEKYTSEPSEIEHALNNSAITQTGQRIKTNMSTSSSVSDKSKCQNLDVFSEIESEGIPATKPMKESKVEVQLLQNYENYRVSTVLSGCSEESQQNSPSTQTSAQQIYINSTKVLVNQHLDNGAANKASTMSDSSTCSQNKTTVAKATVHRRTASKVQRTTKSKQRSCSNLKINKETTKTDTNNAASEISLKTSKSNEKPSSTNKYATKSEVPKSCESKAERSTNLLREEDTDEKPNSGGSKSNTPDKSYGQEEVQHIERNCKNSSRIKQRKIRTTSHGKSEDHAQEQLMPSCLPNASPTDVVHDWLKRIPIGGPMYTMEDEFNDRDEEILLHIPAVKEEGCFQSEIGEQSEKTMRMKKSQVQAGGHEGADPVTEDKNTICDEKLSCTETTLATNSDCSHLSTNLMKKEILVNNCQSSIQVMKVLLSPKLDRCNSLPEVSPTYGKKLSASAKGLLHCLANLQVIDPDPKIYDKYSEIISTLQSLWDNRPSEAMLDKNKAKVQSGEEEFNQRSSSGVDLSSGSIGSINGGPEKSEASPGMTLIAEQKAFQQIQRDVIPRSGCDSLTATPEKINSSLVSSDPITPDIAERVRRSPEYEKLNGETQKNEDLTTTDDAVQDNEHITDITEIASPFFVRNPENNGNVKLSNKEINPPVYVNLRTTSSEQKGQLSKRISQDPDPVWVLSLLKKLEKQFMSHYANAIAEFKVRWDLNDNETLDIMISELKEEVHKRIQSTINRELQKIQSRAGRTPRPPIGMFSKDSPRHTEQRRRRLKVMQNKLINPSKREDINTTYGTEFSYQPSEDEYCPCDTCVKKKMASRVVQCAETLNVAPVLKDFDLRKILLTKKDSPITIPVQSKLDEQKDWTEDTASSNDQNKNNIEMVHEKKTDETQTKDEGTIKTGQRTVKEGTSDDEDDGEPAEEKMFDNNVNEADHGECRTERGRCEVEQDLEKSTEDEDMNRVDDEAEEGDISIDEEVAMENNNPANEDATGRKETESSDNEKGEEDPVGENESNDERTEEEMSEGETNKQSEPGKAEEEEEEEEEEEGKTEEKTDTPEEDEETENRTGDVESSRESKTSRDESVETRNSNVTSDERAQADVLAAAAEPKHRKNKKTELIESKKTGENSSSGKSEAQMSTENNADENQSQMSTEAENEDEKVSHESERKTCRHKPAKRKDSVSVAEQLASDEEDNNLDEYGTDEKHHSDMRAESIVTQAESPDCLNQTCGDNRDCKLLTQITKTSLESQTGSLEYSNDLTVKEKLRDIQSFMESVNDQDS